MSDWHDIALNGRRVVLAFDSDATRKPAVQQALAELAGYLAARARPSSTCIFPTMATARPGWMITSPSMAQMACGN